MADGVLLSAAEYREYKDLVRWFRQMKAAGPVDRRPIDAGHDAAQTPEVHVARAPAGGIPAMNFGANTGTGTGSSDYGDDVPGSADCVVFRCVDVAGVRKLKPVGVKTQTVLNVSYGSVDPGAWVVVARDKFGDWYVLNTIGKDFGTC